LLCSVQLRRKIQCRGASKVDERSKQKHAAPTTPNLVPSLSLTLPRPIFWLASLELLGSLRVYADTMILLGMDRVWARKCLSSLAEEFASDREVRQQATLQVVLHVVDIVVNGTYRGPCIYLVRTAQHTSATMIDLIRRLFLERCRLWQLLLDLLDPLCPASGASRIPVAHSLPSLS